MNRFLVAIIALFTGILITMPSFHVCKHGGAELDHICDYCYERITECEDSERDHICDICGEVTGTCEDADRDHYCDHGCGLYFGEHTDADLNHACDYGCNVAIGAHEDENKDHNCDYGCLTTIGTCRDKDGDGYCDYGCGKALRSEGLSYNSHGDGTCNVSGIGSCTERTVMIPEVSPDGYRVTAINPYAFSNCSDLVSVIIPDSVTHIGEYAFRYCTSLTSVEIPDSVTSIGNSAFYYCKSLTSVEIPDRVESIGSSAFNGCSSLESITIPFVGGSRKTASDTYQYPFGYIFGTSSYSGSTSTTQYYYGYSTYSTTYDYYYIPDSLQSVTVTGGEILYGAFYDCDGLTSVVIGDGVTSIGDYAFYSCDYLANVEIGDGVTSIGDHAFSSCYGLTSVTIPDGVTSIGSYAFAYCYGLTSVEIPDSVTFIGDYAFYDCNSLASVEIGDGVESIGSYAFDSCSGLTSIVIPDGVTTIGSDAFRDCSGLTSVVVPDSVTSIGSAAFNGCSSLESITIPFVGGSEKTASDTYQYPFGYIFGLSSYSGGTGTEQWYCSYNSYSTTSDYYYIPDSLRSVTVTGGEILRGAFYNCHNLTSIAIPDGITSIGDYAFYSCSSLTNVAISDNVTSIGAYAFSDCYSLASVAIGSGVTSVGDSAFYNCDILEGVYITDIAAWCNISFYNSYANPLYYAKNLYLNGELLTDLVVPEGVTAVGSNTFSHCTSLTSVVIPDSVETIGSAAFNGCSSLESITIPFVGGSRKTASYTYQYPLGYIFGTSSYNGGTSTQQYYYGYSTSYTDYTYYYIPTSLRSVTVTDGAILYGAFYNCSSLTSIAIPDGATTIGDYAFYNCTSLASVEIPDSVTSIGSSAFYYCNSLTSVEIPDSVTSIGSYAFYSCDGLVGAEIPDGVTTIGDYAFYDCNSFASVVIPNSVTSIGSYAFAYCGCLTGINYCGTTAQWNSISKGSNWSYGAGSYTITYYYGFTEHTYTFNSNGGSTVASMTAVMIETLPTPTKDNFYFDGWYETADFSGTAISAPYYSTEDITLYAKWLSADEYFSGESFEYAIRISAGESKTVVIDQAGENVYYKIVPTTSKTYTIYSQGSYDTYGYLYDAFGSQINYNDDGGSNYNFSISRYLTAGETYYIVARMYGGNTTGSFTLVVS